MVVQGSGPIVRTEKGIQNRLLPFSLVGIGRKLIDNAAADINKATGAGVGGAAAALDRAVETPCAVDGQAVRGMNSVCAARAEVVDDALRNFSIAFGG